MLNSVGPCPRVCNNKNPFSGYCYSAACIHPELDTCTWFYRPGTNNTHFAVAECDHDSKYLSKLNRCEPYVGVADYYNDYCCPVCGRRINIDYSDIIK